MTSADQAERLRQLAQVNARIEQDQTILPGSAGRAYEAHSTNVNNGGTRSPDHSNGPQNGGHANGSASRTINGSNPPTPRNDSLFRAHSQNGRSVPPSSSRTSFITITSGKGGVGKTNIAVNLAIAMSEQGRRVTLIDADMGTANADVLCGITTPKNLSHLIQGRKRQLVDLAVDAPGGFRLIPGTSGVQQMADLSEADRGILIRELSKLERSSEIVIVDTGAGISEAVTSMANLADLILVVLTPEPTSIADGYGLIKSIHFKLQRAPDRGKQFAILINMASSRQQARAVYDRIASVSRRFLGIHLDFAGHVPNDISVSRSVLKRTPFLLGHPHAPASKAVYGLGESLGRRFSVVDHMSTERREIDRPGYFSRFRQWFLNGS